MSRESNQNLQNQLTNGTSTNILSKHSTQAAKQQTKHSVQNVHRNNANTIYSLKNSSQDEDHAK